MNTFIIAVSGGIIKAHIGQVVALTSPNVSVGGVLEEFDGQTVYLSDAVHNYGSGIELDKDGRYDLTQFDAIHFQDGSIGGGQR